MTFCYLKAKDPKGEKKTKSDTIYNMFVMLNAVQEAVAMGRKCGLMTVKIDEFNEKRYRVHRGRYTLAC